MVFAFTQINNLNLGQRTFLDALFQIQLDILIGNNIIVRLNGGCRRSEQGNTAGESSPATENFEQTRTTKASIVEALEMGFGYCEGVFSRMTDEAGGRTLTFFGSQNTAFGVLAFNSAHNYEHYGNLVTYMRLNGITPPSSMQ